MVVGKNKKNSKVYIILGWREWFQLPELKVEKIKVKIDSGAKTSALHVSEIRYLTKNKKRHVRFTIHPLQKNTRKTIRATALLVEHRKIKSSNGAITRRPVIKTKLKLGEHSWPIELTLINRDEMGFRMLLGRSGVPERFVINPHRSYIFKKKNLANKKTKNKRA